MSKVSFFSGEAVPLEMHKVRIVQKLNLVPIDRRLEALNDELYQSCVTCHEHFRPGYGKRPGR